MSTETILAIIALSLACFSTGWSVANYLSGKQIKGLKEIAELSTEDALRSRMEIKRLQGINVDVDAFVPPVHIVPLTPEEKDSISKAYKKAPYGTILPNFNNPPPSKPKPRNIKANNPKPKGYERRK